MVRKAALAFSLLLAGCTTAKTMMLDDRTALISGRDMGWGDQGDVKRKVLFAAAQIAQSRGYEYFQVLSAEDRTKSGYVAIPGQATANTYGTATCYGASCSGTATTHSTGTPAYLAPYTKAGADVTIRLYHAGEIDPNAEHLYKAASILSSK